MDESSQASASKLNNIRSFDLLSIKPWEIILNFYKSESFEEFNMLPLSYILDENF